MSRLTEKEIDYLIINGEYSEDADRLIREVAYELREYRKLEEQGRLVEVIRCKDCIRHGDEYIAGADGISWCDEYERLTYDDDYCSYAVAKLAEMEGAE